MKGIIEFLNESLELDESTFKQPRLIPRGKIKRNGPLEEEVVNIVRLAIADGTFLFDGKEVGVSKESIYDVFDEELVDRETLDKIIDDLIKYEDLEWKYEKDSEVPRRYKLAKDLI